MLPSSCHAYGEATAHLAVGIVHGAIEFQGNVAHRSRYGHLALHAHGHLLQRTLDGTLQLLAFQLAVEGEGKVLYACLLASLLVAVGDVDVACRDFLNVEVGQCEIGACGVLLGDAVGGKHHEVACAVLLDVEIGLSSLEVEAAQHDAAAPEQLLDVEHCLALRYGSYRIAGGAFGRVDECHIGQSKCHIGKAAEEREVNLPGLHFAGEVLGCHLIDDAREACRSEYQVAGYAYRYDDERKQRGKGDGSCLDPTFHKRQYTLMNE